MSYLQAIAVLLLSVVNNQSSPPTTNIRVGVVAYEDFHDERDHYNNLFAQLSARDPSLSFQLATGSYGDVMHWIDRRLIDAAVVTPGAFASTLSATDDNDSVSYLATVTLPPATSKWASPKRKSEGFHDRYGAVGLVSQISKLQSIADVKRASENGRVQFVFVHPTSVSGYLLPMKVLRQAGIEPTQDQILFSYSHAQSVRMLQEPAPAIERVAFVWDDAAGSNPELEKDVRRFPWSELDSYEIPSDVVIGVNSSSTTRLRELLRGTESGRYRFASISDWRNQILEVRRWLESEGNLASVEDSEQISLDEIAQMLLQYSRAQPIPPRLAVVLSGGGAKCSYQVGAVAALEEKLTELRRWNNLPGLDISLVVGTSGGAINSVPVAMGITRTAEGRRGFRDTWLSLDQREIVRPSLLIRANIGLWLASIQIALVITGVARWVTNSSRQAKAIAYLLTVLGIIEILIAYLPISPWRWLGTNHGWHHLWLWLSFGAVPAAWTLLLIGACGLMLNATRLRQRQPLPIPTWFNKTALLIGVLGLPLLQAITLLFYEATFSGGQGMQRALGVRFSKLIDEHLAEQQLPPLESNASNSDDERLQSISRQVMQRGLLKRDLVITGSCIDQSRDDLPTDLYFYSAVDSEAPKPPFADRGLSLNERPQILLDVVMGSGSIFPIFPQRRLENVPVPDEYIELVDGGFAHNSPIEAAVMWGATHIVLIEATARTPNERGTFLKNAASSFSHLYQQAQLLDARSRGKVMMFSIAPEPPHLCVLDFADNLIAASIERGYDDASSDTANSKPRFTKELGEPVFIDVRPIFASSGSDILP